MPKQTAEIRTDLGIDNKHGWQSLHDILRAFPSLCDRAGVKVSHIARSPESAVTSIAVGIAAIGRMMANIDTAKELDALEVSAIGDLIATTAELIAPLQDIERECERDNL